MDALSDHALYAGVTRENYHGHKVGIEYTIPGTVIIETKSGTAPSVADKHLWRAGIRPVKISKFRYRSGGTQPAAALQ